MPSNISAMKSSVSSFSKSDNQSFSLNLPGTISKRLADCLSPLFWSLPGVFTVDLIVGRPCFEPALVDILRRLLIYRCQYLYGKNSIIDACRRVFFLLHHWSKTILGNAYWASALSNATSFACRIEGYLCSSQLSSSTFIRKWTTRQRNEQ